MKSFVRFAVLSMAGALMASPAAAEYGRFGGYVEPQQVPEPGTIGLFGLGLVGAGLIYMARRKRRNHD